MGLLWGLAQMREVVRQIASLFPTAIISGRGRQKVQRFVQLDELYYAGSHGMDIIGPQVQPLLSLGKQLQKKACFILKLSTTKTGPSKLPTTQLDLSAIVVGVAFWFAGT